MEATPVAQRGHTRLQFLFENHPFRHLVRGAELIRDARQRAIYNARISVVHAQGSDLVYAEKYRQLARTYVWIARERNRRLVGQLRLLREVSP
jgi:hypothetical protein